MSINLFAQPSHGIFLVGFLVYCWIRHDFERRGRAVASVHRYVDGAEKLLLAALFPAALLLPLVFLFTPWLRFADVSQPTWVNGIGVGAMFAGLWLFYRSHADLGTNWSVLLEIKAGHVLVEHGVYRRVRHPMYAAVWLFSGAQGLLLHNWLAGWAVIVPFGLLYLVRVPREERMLVEHFGDAYRTYMARTGRLWPRRSARSPR
ncbi:MAG: protein-S-isoprenylcysteine O-methyltransferase [Planctomycetota bacterium]